MNPMQNIWLTIFNFGPAIILGINKNWWLGLVAIASTFILSWVLVFVVTMNLQGKAMIIWAWVKPPIIATLVLGSGWFLF